MYNVLNVSEILKYRHADIIWGTIKPATKCCCSHFSMTSFINILEESIWQRGSYDL